MIADHLPLIAAEVTTFGLRFLVADCTGNDTPTDATAHCTSNLVAFGWVKDAYLANKSIWCKIRRKLEKIVSRLARNTGFDIKHKIVPRCTNKVFFIVVAKS